MCVNFKAVGLLHVWIFCCNLLPGRVFLSKTDDNRNVDGTAISFGAGKSRTL